MIGSYMVDRIVIVKWAGYDQWNEPLPKTNVSVKGYVEWRTSLVRDIKGENVTSTVKVYMHMKRVDAALGRALTHEDRLLVDGYERAILAIHEPKAFHKPHYEVYLA